MLKTNKQPLPSSVEASSQFNWALESLQVKVKGFTYNEELHATLPKMIPVKITRGKKKSSCAEYGRK